LKPQKIKAKLNNFCPLVVEQHKITVIVKFYDKKECESLFSKTRQII